MIKVGYKTASTLDLASHFSPPHPDYPTPEEFEENLKVRVFGRELKIPIPSLYEFEVLGTQDLEEEELFVPPPLLDARPLLEPT